MHTIQPYVIHSNFFVVRDKATAPTELAALFNDSHAMFRIRMQKLGNVSSVTTDEESDVLRLMLETLIVAKKHLQNS